MGLFDRLKRKRDEVDVDGVTDWPPILPPSRDDYPAEVKEARFTMDEVEASMDAVQVEVVREMRLAAAEGSDKHLAWRQVISRQLVTLGFAYRWDDSHGVTAVASRDGMWRVGIGDEHMAALFAGGVRGEAVGYLLAACALDKDLAWWIEQPGEEPA